MNKSRLLAAAVPAAALAAVVGFAGPASAGNHTVGCAVAPNCVDIFNTQLGGGQVLHVGTTGTAVAGTKVNLFARNPQNSREDFTLIPHGTVTSVLNGDAINYPFLDPSTDEAFILAGDTYVFSVRYTPFGQNSQLYAGLNAFNKLTLEKFGAYGSQQRANNEWVASPLPQFTGATPVVNVGQTNLVGDYEVLTMADGGQQGTRPFVAGAAQDNLGQFPPTQTWGAEQNYP